MARLLLSSLAALLGGVVVCAAAAAQDPATAESSPTEAQSAADGSGDPVGDDGTSASAPDRTPSADGGDADPADALDTPGGFSTTTARRSQHPGRSSSTVTSDDLAFRLPRSAPDAVRYEPGVFVQQTAHAQGSAYLRGRTGQQTVLLFDSVRLNNSLFRQGPNQYFFTIDSMTIAAIDVLRGAASVRYGSDALSGALIARPLEPALDPGVPGFRLRPRLFARHQTADDTWGGRVQLDAQIGPRTGVLLGYGMRRAGLLESGGTIRNPEDGEVPLVPRFGADGRTQLGTGFDELTGDMRVVHRLGRELRVVGAAYLYRQFDAPRTDQCPSAYAPSSECLRYDEQFRTLAYVLLDGDLGSAARRFRATVSWQRQHERRSQDRPDANTVNGGRDDVDSLGLALHARTRRWSLGEPARIALRWGGDVYHDRVGSVAWIEFTDVDVLRYRSRGQYMDGSHYTHGGVFGELELDLLDWIDVRTGVRAGAAGAYSPADADSGTVAVDQRWFTLAANGGVEAEVVRDLTLHVNIDQGYRAPNLDDLTSRQQTGPGFQLENVALRPERALTAEVGARLEHPVVRADAWVYHSTMWCAIARSSRDQDECPANTPQCASSWSRFQLVNLEGMAVIVGAEGSAALTLPHDLWSRVTVSWARGSGPNPERRGEGAAGWSARAPLSRIPPLNGTAELRWMPAWGVHRVWLGHSVRWAALQDRLATSDRSDARIPLGGTPGFAVWDVQAGYRLDPWISVAAVLENVLDTAYRSHGSSVNGAGRGLVIQMEAGF